MGRGKRWRQPQLEEAINEATNAVEDRHRANVSSRIGWKGVEKEEKAGGEEGVSNAA